MFEKYYVGICKNGHVYKYQGSSSYDNYCEECGQALFFRCTHCKALIPPIDFSTLYITELPYNYTPPSYCRRCGNPYPWTEYALAQITEEIREDEVIGDDVKNQIIESLPDVITETPKTSLASKHLKAALKIVSSSLATSLTNFLIKEAVPSVLQSLGL